MSLLEFVLIVLGICVIIGIVIAIAVPVAIVAAIALAISQVTGLSFMAVFVVVGVIAVLTWLVGLLFDG